MRSGPCFVVATSRESIRGRRSRYADDSSCDTEAGAHEVVAEAEAEGFRCRVYRLQLHARELVYQTPPRRKP